TLPWMAGVRRSADGAANTELLRLKQEDVPRRRQTRVQTRNRQVRRRTARSTPDIRIRIDRTAFLIRNESAAIRSDPDAAQVDRVAGVERRRRQSGVGCNIAVQGRRLLVNE